MNKILFNVDCRVIMAHNNTLYTNNKNKKEPARISYLKQQELNTIKQKITIQVYKTNSNTMYRWLLQYERYHL
jgi:hypothetical protein